MKKFLNTAICFMIIFVLACCGMVVFSNSATDDITLGIQLDKDMYCVGDTVTAKVCITDISDAMIGKKFAGFELYLSFDNEYLKYKSGSIDIISGVQDTPGGVHTGSVNGYDDSGVIVALCTPSEEAYTFSDVPAGTSVGVLTLSFDVIKASEEVVPLVSFGNSQEGYESIFVDSKESDYTEIICSVANQSSDAAIYDVFLTNPSAVYNAAEKKVTASVDVGLSTGRSAYLVAGLYDTQGGKDILVKPAKVSLVDVDGVKPVIFENIASVANLEVRYYLWNDLIDIEPLFEAQVADISVDAE